MTDTRDRPSRSRQYRATWRWHFFAGVFAAPFLVLLAVTGLVMLYYTAVETPLGEELVVPAQGRATTPPTQHLAAATAALPAATPTLYIPATTAHSTARVELTHGAAVYAVDINPYNNQVLRTVDKETTPYALAKRIHSSLLLGDVGAVTVEIVAGLGLLLIVTGPYMWLRQRRAGTAVEPSHRSRWRRWHLLTGLYAGVVLCFFLLSGLAWTDIWGGRLVQPWSSFPAQKWGPVPLSKAHHSAMNHGSSKEVPWGLEQTPLPASTAHPHTGEHGAQAAVTLDTVNEQAQALGFGPRYRINLPQDAGGVYTISSTSMTGDTDVPGEERTVHIDRHSAEVIAEVGYDDYSVMAKSMAVGIALHQAGMGRWNIALNVLACVAVLVLCVSGTALWWLRSAARSRWLPAPPPAAGLPLRSMLTALLVLMGLAIPLLGLTMALGVLVYAAQRQWRH